MPDASTKVPLLAMLIGALGALALVAGIISLTGIGSAWHPLLESRVAGLAYLVLGLGLIAFEVTAILRFIGQRNETTQ